MFGSLQLAPIYYYNVPTSIGNIDEKKCLLISTDKNIIHEGSAQWGGSLNRKSKVDCTAPPLPPKAT